MLLFLRKSTNQHHDLIFIHNGVVIQLLYRIIDSFSLFRNKVSNDKCAAIRIHDLGFIDMVLIWYTVYLCLFLRCLATDSCSDSRRKLRAVGRFEAGAVGIMEFNKICRKPEINLQVWRELREVQDDDRLLLSAYRWSDYRITQPVRTTLAQKHV